MMTHPPSEEQRVLGPNHPPQSSPTSLFITLLSSLFLLTSIGVIVWSSSTLSPLDHVKDPQRSLERLISRAMMLEHAMTHVNRGERFAYRILSGNEDVLMRSTLDYQELADFSNDPLVDLYLTILEAEAGQRDKIAKRIDAWKMDAAPLPLFGQLIRSAYFRDALSPGQAERLQAYLAEEIPDNWFYRRLAIQLAKKANDRNFELLTEQQMDADGYQLLRTNRWLILLEVSGCLMGLLLIIKLVRKSLRQRTAALMTVRGTLPPPWSGRDGFAVLMRGGAVTTLLLFSLSFLEFANDVMVIVSMAILYGPILILTYFHLLFPNDVSIFRAFGLRMAPDKIPRVGAVVVIVLSAGLIGDWIIALGLGGTQGSIHWTEWFDQSLVWGTSTEVAATLLEYSIIAPVLEEVIFRGVVFGSLRRRFGWGASAILSALVFSFVHGYGLLGLLTVFWSGVLWAWAYEKTGSLWPSMIAHGLNNLLVSLTLVALFR